VVTAALADGKAAISEVVIVSIRSIAIAVAFVLLLKVCILFSPLFYSCCEEQECGSCYVIAALIWF
jgi:hypothetical protein